MPVELAVYKSTVPPSYAPGNDEVRRAAGACAAILAAALLGGCVGPLLSYSEHVPALVLRPLAAKEVRDGRVRFRELLCAVNEADGGYAPNRRPCEQILHRLPDEAPRTGTGARLGPLGTKLRIFIIPGIFGECVAHVVRPFEEGWGRVRALGAQVEFLPVSGRSGSAHNAAQIAKGLESAKIGSDERVVLVAYSKGASDSLEALAAYPSVAARADALVSVAGVINGTPIADRLSSLYEGLLANLPYSDCAPGDGLGVASLRRSERLGWLARAALPERVRYYSIAGFEDHGAISGVLRPFWEALGHVDPRNDGQVIFYDALIPGGTLLGFTRTDHWAITLPFTSALHPRGTPLVEHNGFPREVLFEAIVRYVAEDMVR